MHIFSDFVVKNKKVFPSGCCLLRLEPIDCSANVDCHPGQFVQVKTECQDVFLRRPISICNASADGCLELFIKPLGKGSQWLTERCLGDKLNIISPLGHGFTLCGKGEKVLLAGGGVGAAPLVFLSRKLSEAGADVSVVLGGRSKADVEQLPELYKASSVSVSTDDGSMGEKGVITQNSIFNDNFDRIYCCGPTPMMKAVARIAKERGIWCEVSLENMMACGLGACLCCVQDTDDHGNVCVCTEGPVFNINRLQSWL